ncbi:MAG: tRNA 2-thiouridine(34) synthase MnmA [Chloroflexi bacterium]|nr:tRNA 2-thiouridine(34) synthase MnmA [Chloroflexota bacterium]
MNKVAVAMSGGVDSSVTAALLKDAGYDVFGITMLVHSSNNAPSDDAAQANEVALILNIPHHIVNLSDIFSQNIISYFCSEYALGRTPNPCVRCNHLIKFGALLDHAKSLGADLIATGHYSRLEKEGELFFLKKGIDLTKDQSYFLSALTQRQLRHALMPLGTLTKKSVRMKAKELNLPVVERAESQEICFIPDNDYAAFVNEHSVQASQPGPIKNSEGKVLGEHRGIINYTIGQRKGLGIAAKEPLFVVAIDSARNTVIVGSKHEVYGTEFTATGMNWIAFETLLYPIQTKARIRYHHKEKSAQITPLQDGRVHVEFKEPQPAITPGQAVVFYEGDVVVGGGTIE